MTFATEITNIKAEINSGLSASQYSAKDLVYVAKALEALAATESYGGTFESLNINSYLYLGTDAYTFAAGLTNPVAVFQTSATDYSQIAFRNTSNGINASTDLILYTNDGTDLSGFIDVGMTSTNFADPDFTITGRGDGYIFVSGSGNDGNDQGNLVLATDSTGTQNKIIFAAGGLASDNTQMVITPDENIHIEIDTPSTSPTTGALTVVGGVGITGDVNINGAITFGGTGTTVETANLSVSDPIVFTGNTNTGDALDLGLVGKYVTGGNTRYSGVVRDASDGVIKFFSNATTQPTSTVNFAESGLAYADIKVDNVEAASANITSATIGSVTNTEIGYLSGATSAIQTQIDAKAALISPTFTGTVVLPSSTSVGDVDGTEIGYLNGVSSNIQTQLDAKLSTSTASSTYAPLLQTTAAPTFSSNNYTLVLGDASKILLASNSSTAGTVTIPLNSSVAFSTGTIITITQTGSGQLTLTPTGGVTINSFQSQTKLSGQFASAQLIKTGTDTWLAVGNLTV